ncbi:MAG: ATP-dependent sacrificial sulfur transferase LarE [Desulfobacterium sp.]|nr:ATP-dependent sacrificial sulfur transferase LarE [Desulfobacterium sp.]
MTDKLKALIQNLKEYEKIAICFSGGVDSSLLAAVAKKACESVVAITARTEFQSRQEVENAACMARSIGIRHVVVRASVLEDLRIVENTPRRCYFCKKMIFSLIRDKAFDLGFETVAHGANLDDLADYRPGFEATREMRIIAPLIDAGLTKGEVRELSKAVGLEIWNLEAQSCLATRIPYGDIITPENLGMVEAGEALLRSLGFTGVRVRVHGQAARIELGSKPGSRDSGVNHQMENIMDEKIRQEVVSGFKKIGFKYVSLDLEGYVMGSMNRSLA